MTVSRSSLTRAGATALLLLGGFFGGVQAATMTPAGTTISNTATLDYKVGTTPQTQICSSPTGVGPCASTDFKVDNKVNLTVSLQSGAASAIPSAFSTTTFRITNLGNSPQDYVLTTDFGSTYGTVTIGGTAYTRTFDPASTCSVLDMANAAIAGNRLTNVANETYVDVQVVCQIPGLNNVAAGTPALTNSDSAIVMLKAQTYDISNGAVVNTSTSVANDPTKVDIVLADGAGVDDGLKDGAFTARGAMKIQTAVLSVKKTSAALCDPINGATNPKNIPGSYVQYTITVTNDSNAPASAMLTTVGDALSTALTFDSDFITGAGAAAACAASPAGTPTSAGKVMRLKLNNNNRTIGFSSGIRDLATSDFTLSGQNISIPLATLLPVDGTYKAGELKKGESLDIIFNAIIK